MNLLNAEELDKQGIFNYEYIKNIIDEHLSGRKNRKSEIWTLFVFQRWYREMMEE